MQGRRFYLTQIGERNMRRWFDTLFLWLLCDVVPFLVTGQLAAQAVQLPTYGQFGVSTTVSVPDQGSILLGGIRQGAEGSVSRGLPGLGPLFRNRASGRSIGNSQVVLSATIIDHQELDEAVLAAARQLPRREVSAAELARQQRADFMTANITRGTVSSLATIRESRETETTRTTNPSIEQVQQASQLAMERRAREARDYLQKGRQAEADRKLGVAKIYYQMAARRADEPLRQQLLGRIQYLEQLRTAGNLAAGN